MKGAFSPQNSSVCSSVWGSTEATARCVVLFPYWKWELYLAQFPWKVPVYVLPLCLMQNDGTCRRLSLRSRLSVWPYYLSTDDRGSVASSLCQAAIVSRGNGNCLFAGVYRDLCVPIKMEQM